MAHFLFLHEKLIEETPSPASFLSRPGARERLLAAAVDVVSAQPYVGLATVEFVVDASDNPYFLEVNPRLQVEHGITEPPGGLIIPTGIANPVLIALGIAVLMTILATRRRFGRYVYAIGGNPEAATLSGINTRRVIMMTFVIMGLLAAASAVVSTARLQSAVSGLGVGAELSVIAAAVIGGTSFAGGIGTIPGAVLGALIIQSLVTGMQLLKFDNPSQDVAVGVVLVAAVGLDQVIRKRTS